MKSAKIVLVFIVAISLVFSGYDLSFLSRPAGIALAAGDNESLIIPDCIPETAEKRSEHKRHLPKYENEHIVAFENEDGSSTFYIFQSPVMYKDGEGDLQYYDNSIVEIRDGAKTDNGMKYKIKSSDKNVFFPDNFSSDKKIKLESDGDWIAFRPKNATRTKKAASEDDTFSIDDTISAENTGLGTESADSISSADDVTTSSDEVASREESPSESERVSSSLKNKYTSNPLKSDTIVYSNVSNGVDIEYSLMNKGVKEDIILHKYTGNNVFEFDFTTSGLIPELQEDMSVLFLDPDTKDVKALIESVYVRDSYAGEKVENDGHDAFDSIVGIQPVDGSPNHYIYSIEVSKEFLEKSDTVYPVVIDPSVTWHNDDVEYDDTQIASKYKTKKYYYYSNLRVGYSDDYGTLRSLVQFPIDDLILENPTGITSAYYYINETTGNTGSAYIGVFRIDSSWNEEDTVWNTCPDVNLTSPVHGWVLINKSKRYKFEITDLVTNWLYNANDITPSYPNYGFMLKMQTENKYRNFISSDYNYGNNPYVEINYTNTDEYPPNPIPEPPDLDIVPSGVNEGFCTLGVTFQLATDEPAYPALNTGIGGYKLYLNGEYAQTVGANPVFPITTIIGQPWTVPDNASYYVSVIACDKNVPPLESSSVPSDTLPAPDRSAPIWEPNAKVIVNGSETDNWTNGTHPSISWDGASDEGGNIDHVMWSLSDSVESGGYQNTGSNVTPGSVSAGVIDLSALPDGEHNIYMRACDDANVENTLSQDGTGNYSDAIFGVYRKDTVAPTATMNSPEVDDASFCGTLSIYGYVSDYTEGVATSGIGPLGACLWSWFGFGSCLY